MSSADDDREHQIPGKQKNWNHFPDHNEKGKKNNQSNVAKRNFHDHTLSFDFPFLNAEKCAEAKNDLFFFTIKPLSGKSKRERSFRPVCFSAEGASAVTSDNTGRDCLPQQDPERRSC